MLIAQGFLLNVYVAQGRLSEAEQIGLAILAGARKVLGARRKNNGAIPGPRRLEVSDPYGDVPRRRWRQDRDEVTSWSTPLIVRQGDGAQVIVSGTKRVRGYDLATGRVIWECAGLSHNIVASPVAADGMVFVGSSYEKRRMFGIKLAGAKGDITATDNVAWRRARRTPYVPSPLLYDGWLYFLTHYQGFLSKVVAKTGEEPQKPMRLEGMYEIYASPVAAAGRIYITDRDGITLVLSHGKGAPAVLARNRLDDGFNASAAIAGDEIFLRGRSHLYCIARSKPAAGSGTDSRPDR
jgi:outer membrane protein assembly factor BamB